MDVDHTHDPAASSWIAGADEHAEFPVQNLPLGVASPAGTAPRIVSIVGEAIVDLAALARSGLLSDEAAQPLQQPTLNALFALAPAYRRALRHALFELLTDRAVRARVEPHLIEAASCTLHLPALIGDYTDFYTGIHHAEAIGRQFRPDNPLLPNYKHVPIGYHGRASSIRVSGAPLVRPLGQTMPPGADVPMFGPSRRLDYEVELGIWIAGENRLGEPTPIARADDRIAGLCLLNDWSARDIQAWEYQPLGPFLAKSFLTSVSPWVVTAEALAPFRVAQPPRPAGDPRPLPYLWDAGDQDHGGFALSLEVSLSTARMRESGVAPHRLSRTSAEAMYWTAAQLVAHHTCGGCNLVAGDLLGSGTLSGPTPQSAGSLTELTRAGADPIALPGGETRGFLEDGDTITISGRAERTGCRTIGLGTCSGTVLPAPR